MMPQRRRERPARRVRPLRRDARERRSAPIVGSIRVGYCLDMDTAQLDEALETLGAVLESRGERYDLVLIGGGALLLLGLIERPTRDLDIVSRVEGDRWVEGEPMPEGLAKAIVEVARALDLDDHWLNAGPTNLLRFGLPAGFADRVSVRRYQALTVRLAARVDQVAFKLYAAVDQGPRSKHFRDLQRLGPTEDELLSAARWCRTHDTSEPFRDMLVQALGSLGVESGDV